MKATNLIIIRLVIGCIIAVGLLSHSSFAQISFPPPGGGGGGCTNCPVSYVNTNRNYVKFMNHEFSVLDTNIVAQADTNLYNALIAFPDDTNSEPTLQVALYGANTLLIKANHFDYSAETTRELALLICDKAESPTWKSIDFLGASDAQDGWLVQGSVPAWKVTDLMYFKISNIARDCNAFFRAIPYEGAQVNFISPQPYDVVSNTISIEAAVSDLSGITNAQFEVTVDGLPARYSLGSNSIISLNTKYNPEGPVNITLRSQNRARVYNLTNRLDNQKIFFSGAETLPLTFENDTYLLFQSDHASPDIGTNYFYYVTDKPQTITASIYSPVNGRVVKSFSGYVPFAATISLSWNFTEANGTTPYSNDTYAVTFQTSNPTTLTYTNEIARDGVRNAAGCFITYQWEDPLLPNGDLLNEQAGARLGGDLAQLYNDLYKPLSLTQYTVNDIGTNRNHGGCSPYTPWVTSWPDIMKNAMTNSPVFSDLTIGQAHGSGGSIGGSSYLTQKFSPLDLKLWCVNSPSKNWRLRKSALWACYTGSILLTTAGDLYPTWAEACGIRPEAIQVSSRSYKNCGFFFAGELPQAFYDNALGSAKVTAVAAAALDQTWICGKFQYPGGCDPTYSFRFAAQATIGRYDGIVNGIPVRAGYAYCVYTANQDSLLRDNDTSQVKNN